MCISSSAELIFFLVPAIFRIPDVIITNSIGQERNIGLLDANKNYAINLRAERWDQQFKVFHMIYQTAQNRWTRSRTNLKHVFQNMLIDDVKIFPTQVSVILVLTNSNNLKVSYASPVFSLLNRNSSRMCTDWIARENKRFNKTISSQSCPCTLQEAKQDPNYVDDIYCTSFDVHYFWKAENCRRNKEAYHCMVIKQSM